MIVTDSFTKVLILLYGNERFHVSNFGKKENCVFPKTLSKSCLSP